MDDPELAVLLKDYFPADIIRAALERPGCDDDAGERERVLAGIGVMANLYRAPH